MALSDKSVRVNHDVREDGEETEPPILKKTKSFTRSREIKALGLYPYFRPISSAQDTEVVIQGQKVLMLGSNSYLGLTNHPEIKKAVQAAVEKYGSGCAGSRFLNGTLHIHLELEARLAAFTGQEAALVFSTGFQVNLGSIPAIMDPGDILITDKEVHASIVDGVRMARSLKKVETRHFKHNDPADLEAILKALPEKPGKLVVVDGVFSMEGDIVDLPGIVPLARKYGARLVVDDAHGIGVLGENGRGTAEHFGLEAEGWRIEFRNMRIKALE